MVTGKGLTKKPLSFRHPGLDQRDANSCDNEGAYRDHPSTSERPTFANAGRDGPIKLIDAKISDEEDQTGKDKIGTEFAHGGQNTTPNPLVTIV